MAKAKRRAKRPPAVAFVIKYDGSTESYFRGWAGGAVAKLSGGRTTGLPAFGATIDESPRYATRMDACREIDAMPMMASLMCDVEEVPA